MIGPGKYDDACTTVRETTLAQGVLLVVIGGSRGDGFSVQSADAELTRHLPSILRRVADLMEPHVAADYRQMTKDKP